MIMYALYLIENDINFMADTTSITDSTVRFYFIFLQWLVCVARILMGWKCCLDVSQSLYLVSTQTN